MLELLKLNEFYGESEAIEIAKGKNELAQSWKTVFKQLKRKTKWLKRI